MLLTIKNISVHYGEVEAIKNISLEVDNGEIIALIGANGAGKSTLVRSISGLKKLTAGDIIFRGERIDNLPPSKIVKAGIAHVPEGERVFSLMSVYDNLMLGAFLRRDEQGIKKDLQLVFGHFPVLKERLKQQAGSLSGGEQQMLALGRALMIRPTLLLLDEPSLGLAPKLVAETSKIIRKINTDRVSILLIEQNAHMALAISHRGYVLETGQIVLSGDARELTRNRDIKRAYLGV